MCDCRSLVGVVACWAMEWVVEWIWWVIYWLFYNSSRWISWLLNRWRTQRTAICNANCRSLWVIESLNAYCTSFVLLGVCLLECDLTCMSVLLYSLWGGGVDTTMIDGGCYSTVDLHWNGWFWLVGYSIGKYQWAIPIPFSPLFHLQSSKKTCWIEASN